MTSIAAVGVTWQTRMVDSVPTQHHMPVTSITANSHLNTMATSSLRVGTRCDVPTSAFLWGDSQLIKERGLGQWTSVFTMAQWQRVSLWLAVVCGLGLLTRGNVHVYSQLTPVLSYCYYL